MEEKERKFRFSEQPLRAKILYGAVVVILCVSALIVGIVGAASRKEPPDRIDPPVSDDTPKDTPHNDPPPAPPEEKVTYTAPVSGTIGTGHSLSMPVFSDTLREWRLHTGIDIMTDDAAPVCASAPGTVSKITQDPLLGTTVEISHKDDVTTVYSNLDKTLATGITLGKVVKAGDAIGKVGDTSVSERAAEAHLHFGVRVRGVEVDPLSYLCDRAKTEIGVKQS